MGTGGVWANWGLRVMLISLASQTQASATTAHHHHDNAGMSQSFIFQSHALRREFARTTHSEVLVAHILALCHPIDVHGIRDTTQERGRYRGISNAPSLRMEAPSF
jgi:hypothetical protein